MPDTDVREVPAKGPLSALELATGSVLAGISVALVVFGWFFPHASAVGALAAVPMGVIAHHHRARALIAATVAASTVGFLVAGTGPVYGIVGCALVGGVVGSGKRRGWGVARTMLAATAVAPLIAGAIIAVLALFASLRRLTLLQVTNGWRGVARLADHLPVLRSPVATANSLVHLAVRDWWATTAVVVVVGFLWGAALAWLVLGTVLDRLAWMRELGGFEVPPDPRDPEPLPVWLHQVRYRYPGAGSDALDGVELTVRPGSWVGVVGDNGSGKSTLARILAGRPPTSGTAHRPGSSGLGRPGGTATILQRPETQVLGVRVTDDVVWGMGAAAAAATDVEGLLAAVGLTGMGGRDTSTLSGGELQRLAVASALARRPRLLISDESTAMVDATGRAQLTVLLAGLPAAHGVTVVHVTHRPEEVEHADRVLRLARGRVTSVGAPEPADGPIPGTAFVGAPRGHSPLRPHPLPDLLRLTGVTHVYNDATPWAQVALERIDLSVAAGAGLLVVGGNGSGKSTLAWILAGLTRPTWGHVDLEGRPVAEQVGTVAMAFQHARLQLQRPDVSADIRAAAGPDGRSPEEALGLVGLEPGRFADRRIDQLSGGEMRRVALAGLLARRPRVLVLDEPLAGLDRPSRASLVTLLGRLRSDTGLTLVVISHDLEGLGGVCDRLLRLDHGRVVTDDAPSGLPR